MLNINIASDFHNALNDAEYTVEVFRIVKPEILITERFKPSDIKSVKPKIKAKRINTKSMFKYFSQSLERELTSEEKAIIKTAYKLGRNNTYDLLFNKFVFLSKTLVFLLCICYIKFCLYQIR